jgi:hypothetical protein
MIAASAVLRATDEAAHWRLDQAVAVDLLWGASQPDDRLEHVYVRSEPGLLYVVAFVLAESQKAASKVTKSLCERGIHQSPLLNAWEFAG